eukprot:1281664-Rhodomonas_salina.4
MGRSEGMERGRRMRLRGWVASTAGSCRSRRTWRMFTRLELLRDPDRRGLTMVGLTHHRKGGVQHGGQPEKGGQRSGGEGARG